ncbi:hypothetical protein DPMN_186273 [Dreissena polymorpha]|uniref:Uncharacterized protein n=1 Tax=Dreissena polymorpha TaxID=45954 RepID=A0A9D4I818_DREPO|nr:hypothetical protein DPMN_186273 [Dreissena polymorpha]
MTRHHQQIPRHHAEACRGDEMRSASADRRGYSATRYTISWEELWLKLEVQIEKDEDSCTEENYRKIFSFVESQLEKLEKCLKEKYLFIRLGSTLLTKKESDGQWLKFYLVDRNEENINTCCQDIKWLIPRNKHCQQDQLQYWKGKVRQLPIVYFHFHNNPTVLIDVDYMYLRILLGFNGF